MHDDRMEWSDLRIFLAVARGGTLGAAGRELGQTQPTMGRRIRALEAALGQTLFQRTSEGFLLTNEGAAVLAHAERMESEALGIARAASGQPGELDGSLRVSSSDWFGAHVLTRAVASMHRRHPGVTIEPITQVNVSLWSTPSTIIAPTITMPWIAFVPDISGVCRSVGTFEITSKPRKIASIRIVSSVTS